MKIPLKERFEKYYVKDKKSDCWLWTGFINPDGYGLFSYKNKCVRAHAISKFIYDNVPVNSNRRSNKNKLQWDHLCNVRNCVNPKHLELKSSRDNTLRSNAVSAINSRKTHCLRGHDLSVHYMKDRLKRIGSRSCYLCFKIRYKKYYAVKNAWRKKILRVDQVIKIFNLLKKKATPNEIANRYGFKLQTIRHIRSGYAWSSVTGIKYKSHGKVKTLGHK